MLHGIINTNKELNERKNHQKTIKNVIINSAKNEEGIIMEGRKQNLIFNLF